MKPFGRSILFSAALALGAGALSAAPANSDQFEQWHRTKFGRPSPTEEARQKAERANSAFREEVTPAPTAQEWSNYLFDQRFRAKYGRPSPTEEQRLKAERENTAFREEITPVAKPTADAFREEWFKTKFGRHSPLYESTAKGNRR